MASQADRIIVKLFSYVPYLNLDDKYLSHYRFRKFTKYTLIMAAGYAANVPLIWLFQDYFHIHWFFSVGFAAFIVHILKFFTNDRWTWGEK